MSGLCLAGLGLAGTPAMAAGQRRRVAGRSRGASANMGFTELTGDGGSGFWALDEALQTVGTGITPAEDLVHYNGSTWTVEALPAIPDSTRAPRP